MARTYPIGIGESRIVTVDLAAEIPAGATIAADPAPTVHVETLDGVTDDGFTVDTIQIDGESVSFVLTVGEAVDPGTYQLEVEATLSNGEEVQARDARGYGMILVVRH